ncbi:MAG: alpha-E domain-containing protein [Hyphomicrobiaceae bacterium]
MLSRTAESLFWLGRYMERADSTARLIEMGRRMTMVPSTNRHAEWLSLVKAAGAPIELAEVDTITEQRAIDILLLSLENQSSIRNCLAQARFNGRAVRTALTQDMWEALNDGWRRLDSLDARTACRDLSSITDWVKARSAALRGATEIGMLRGDGYDFLRLGGLVERADMMLRLLDVKYYVLLPETESVGGGRDHHQWASVLYANSAIRAYHHVYGGDHTPWKIADFLILNQDFPRSLAFCYARIGDHLERLARRYGQRHQCHTIATDMIARLADIEMGEIFQIGLHEYIDETIAFNGQLSQSIARAYYFR